MNTSMQDGGYLVTDVLYAYSMPLSGTSDWILPGRNSEQDAGDAGGFQRKHKR